MLSAPLAAASNVNSSLQVCGTAFVMVGDEPR